jgi:hypothetical protein
MIGGALAYDSEVTADVWLTLLVTSEELLILVQGT